MNLQTSRPFEHDYRRLPDEVKAQVDKQLVLLLSNPRHPSLRLKPIQGTADIWEIRVNLAYRITLEIAGESYVLRRVGTHDVLRRP